ncbi:hypothetical protein HDU83_006537 [Entophlyctis luteolus]|nr:hypothetical protein HDU83_006537 [Entophlyctis luteolus]KAJ3379815.1 hypothetical protein HDU84_006359 [Entophlyctis sp. JEL0112]
MSAALTPTQIADYALQLSVYAIGALLCTAVLAAFVRAPRVLLATRLNRWVAAVVVVSFAWSIMRVAVFAMTLIGVDPANSFYPASACLSSVVVLIIFVLNISLAAERYFTVRIDGRKWFFVIVYSTWAVILCIVIRIYVTAPSNDTVYPSKSPEIEIWLSTITLSFFVTVIMTTFFYTSTYYATSYQLSQNPQLLEVFLADGTASDVSDLIRVQEKVERKLFLQCVLLSVGIVVCYFPFLVLNISYVAAGSRITFLIENMNTTIVFSVLVAMDTVFTPALVLFFKQDVRENAMFWKRS